MEAWLIRMMLRGEGDGAGLTEPGTTLVAPFSIVKSDNIQWVLQVWYGGPRGAGCCSEKGVRLHFI